MRGLPGPMHCLALDAAVVSTLDHIPDSELGPEGFAPHDSEKLSRAACLLINAADHALA